jgi:hypothetical protein
MAKEREPSEESIGEAWRRYRSKSLEERAEFAKEALRAKFRKQEIEEKLDAERFLEQARFAKTSEVKARLMLEYGSVTGVTNPEYVNQPPEIISRDFSVICAELRRKYRKN